MNSVFKRALALTAIAILGHRKLERVSRFLLNTSRLDTQNDPHENGEILVQHSVMAAAKSGDVVFDVGANVGDWTASLIAETAVPLKVFCFEPTPSTALNLRNRLKSLPMPGSVEIVEMILSDYQGETDFFDYGENAGRNSRFPIFEAKSAKVRKLPTTSIDAFCRKRGIEEILFLKIDTEGNDALVLQGAREALLERRIKFLQFEYNHRWIFARSFLKDAMDGLIEKGYRIGKVTPKGILWLEAWNPNLESFQEGNYFGCRADAACPVQSIKLK